MGYIQRSMTLGICPRRYVSLRLCSGLLQVDMFKGVCSNEIVRGLCPSGILISPMRFFQESKSGGISKGVWSKEYVRGYVQSGGCIEIMFWVIASGYVQRSMFKWNCQRVMSKRTGNKSVRFFQESKSGGMSKWVCSKVYVRGYVQGGGLIWKWCMSESISKWVYLGIIAIWYR